MFRFQHIDHIYFLALLPVLVILFIGMIVWRKNKLKTIGEQRLISMQLLGFIPGRPTSKFILLLIAFTAAIAGWANLQKGSGTEEVQRKGFNNAHRAPDASWCGCVQYIGTNVHQ